MGLQDPRLDSPCGPDRGNVIRKTDPDPLLASDIRPPLASTAHLAIARPNPAPPLPRERPSSIR